MYSEIYDNTVQVSKLLVFHAFSVIPARKCVGYRKRVCLRPPTRTCLELSYYACQCLATGSQSSWMLDQPRPCIVLVIVSNTFFFHISSKHISSSYISLCNITRIFLVYMITGFFLLNTSFEYFSLILAAP